MMNDVIHVHVYNPAKSLFKTSANEKAEMHTYTCDRASVCDAYKDGKCILVGNPFGPSCFGRKSVLIGPTKRAKSFSEFVDRAQGHEKYKALKTQPNRIFRVGEGYFFPYAHIALGEDTPFERKSSFFGGGFPYLEEANLTNLSKLYNHRPCAMMGGEIKSYQENVLPQLVKHMHSNYPDLYSDLLSVHPEARDLVDNFDYTGKQAKINTLSPGNMKIGTNYWDWDGEYLTGPGENMIFAPADATHIRITPSPDAFIKVTNVEMVNSETVIGD